MKENQTLPEISAEILTRMTGLIKDCSPDIVLVHGDTTTAMAAAMAAFYARVPVGHVEAGLRSRNIWQPWPEEFNRIAIDNVSTFLFAPTRSSELNLQAESSISGSIYVTGNTGIDALLYMKDNITGVKLRSFEDKYQSYDRDRRLILVTGHRRENFGIGFENICQALAKLAERGDVEIVYPVHLNPNVKDIVFNMLGKNDNIHLIEPVGYDEMVYLMMRCYFIMTDSGGIQEEAPVLGKPVLVMRDVTERPEAVEAGAVRVVGTDWKNLVDEAERLLDSTAAYKNMAQSISPYGDGTASVQIGQILENWIDARN